VLPVTPRVFESGRLVSNGPLRAGDPVLFPMSYVRMNTSGWDRTSVLCRRRTALIPLSYGRSPGLAVSAAREPPAGVEPAPRPYKGRVLAVDTTEAGEWRRRESNPLLLGASEAFFRKNLIPKGPRPLMGPISALVPARVEDVGSVNGRAPCSTAMRTGGVEPPQPVATRLQRGELSRAQRPQVSSAGGIRTHGLELMRLARTAPPLPREVWLAGVEPAISGAQNRRDGLSPTARGPGRGPGGARKVDDRGIEPRSTAVSERCLPSRPVVESNAVAFRSHRPRSGRSRSFGARHRRRQGIAPCLPGSQPGGSLLAVRRSLAGRSRTPVPHGRSVVLTTELRRERTPSTGVEPASPGRQPGRVSRRVRGRAVCSTPSGN
jgi:hypothetical protein